MAVKLNTVWGLNSEAASALYWRVAGRIASPAPDARHANLGARWLSLEAVQRSMRAAGVDEEYITGEASDFEKLSALLAFMPRLTGHRVARWCAYDLATTFGCDLSLAAEHAEAIWQQTAPQFAAHTWESPKIFCPVATLNCLERGMKSAVEALGASTGVAVKNLDALFAAYHLLLKKFAAKGGKTLLLSLNPDFFFIPPDPYHANEIFVRALAKDGKGMKDEERCLFFAQLVRFFATECMRLDLTLGFLLEKSMRCGEVVLSQPIADVGGLAALLQCLQKAGILPNVLLAARSTDELIAVASLCEAFAAKNEKPRVRPALYISPCFDPDEMRADLQRLSTHLPIGSLVPMLAEPQGIVRDALARVLCTMLADSEDAEDLIVQILSQAK